MNAQPLRSSQSDSAAVPTCGLPAVGAYVAYRRQPGNASGLESLGAHPFCRFHEESQRAAAEEEARAVPAGTYYGAYPVEYTAGQARVACKADRNPVQLAAALDAERITAAAGEARAALQRLTALTTVAHGGSFEVGNEAAVLEQLLDLVDDVEDRLGVVARRLAHRSEGGWHRVVEATHGVRPDDSPAVRDQLAVKAWHRWGGGPGDEQPPAPSPAR